MLRVLLTCASVLASLPAQRERVGGSSFAHDPDGVTYLEVDHESECERLVWGDRAELDLPFDLPGEPLALGAHRFLVPGVSSLDRVATILCVRLDETSRSIVIEQRRDYGNRVDPYALCWRTDEGRLYLLDFEGLQVRVAPFNGGELPESDRFVPIAASDLAPELDIAPYITHMFAPSDGSAGVVLNEHECLLPYVCTRLVPDGCGDWIAMPEQVGTRSPRVLALDHGSHVNARGPMRVAGVRGGVVLEEATFLRHEVAQATIFDPGLHLALSLPPAGVLPGLKYLIHQSWTANDCEFEFPAAFPFVALVRYGVPQVDATAAMPFGQIAGHGAWPGNPAFSTIGWFGAGSGLDAPVDLEVYLAMSARHEDGMDPVRTRDRDTAHLTEVLALAGPFRVSIRDPARREGLQVELPIPEHHELKGGVLLLQWVAVTPRGDAAVSDVFGTMLVPLPDRQHGPWHKTDETTLAWLREARARYPRVPAASVEAIRRWLAGKPEWAMNEARLTRWREIAK